MLNLTFNEDLTTAPAENQPIFGTEPNYQQIVTHRAEATEERTRNGVRSNILTSFCYT